MTEEELQTIREASNTYTYYWPTREEVKKLVAEIDFLRQLIHDLKEESTAYKHGLEDGIKAERKLRRKMMDDYDEEIRQLRLHIDLYGSSF